MRKLPALFLSLFWLMPQVPSATYIPVPHTAFSLGYGGLSGTKTQVLNVSPKQLQEIPNRPGYYIDGVYELDFGVTNYFPAYPGFYDVEVSFGTQQLCESYGWGTGIPTTVKLICPGSAYLVADKALPLGGPVQGSHNLVVTFFVPGWTLNFDNVSLSFTPSN